MTQTSSSNVGVVRMPITDVVENLIVHVEVTGLRTWKVRLWLGAMFIYFGVWITGMNAEVDIRASDD